MYPKPGFRLPVPPLVHTTEVVVNGSNDILYIFNHTRLISEEKFQYIYIYRVKILQRQKYFAIKKIGLVVGAVSVTCFLNITVTIPIVDTIL